MPTIQTHGAVAGYTVTTNRRPASLDDAHYQLGLTQQTTLAVTVTNAQSVAYEVSRMDDNPATAVAARSVGLGIIAAFAAIGASTTLGTPGQSPVTQAPPNGLTQFSKVVDLVPGTPLPAGTAIVIGSGTFTLKLADGGTIDVQDVTSGAGGTPIRSVLAIDAVVPSGGKVKMAY